MRTVETEIGAILEGAISEITRRSIFRRLGGVARAPLQHLTTQDRQAIQGELESSVRLFAPARSTELIAACSRALALAGAPTAAPAAVRPQAARRPAANLAALSGSSGISAISTVSAVSALSASSAVSGIAAADKRLAIEGESDIAAARLEAWSEAVRIGLSKFTSVKVATAVSELARNIVFYAGRGTIELRSHQEAREIRLEIVAVDQGPGIDPARLETIFAGTYRSERGMGKGLVAVQKLVDEFAIDTRPGRGTRVSCAFRSAR